MALSPSQRITLITVASQRLGAEDWSMIDLVLGQFSLPTAQTWNGSQEAYVQTMAAKGSDDQLVGLAAHLGFHLPELSGSSVEPAFWQKDMLRVFVSHLAAHRAFAAELQTALLKYGISCFVAHNDIEPTQEWQTQIEIALATCESLIALLHPTFHASNWTDQEIGFAMGRNVPVFSVRFGQDPYGFIGRFQGFNGNGKTTADLARELFDVYRKNKQSQKRMGEVLVRLFEQSASYAYSKTWLSYLEELESWQPSFAERIQAALGNNSQISESWGVADRVAALSKKWKGV